MLALHGAMHSADAGSHIRGPPDRMDPFVDYCLTVDSCGSRSRASFEVEYSRRRCSIGLAIQIDGAPMAIHLEPICLYASLHCRSR
jgi:hypothetical protein